MITTGAHVRPQPATSCMLKFGSTSQRSVAVKSLLPVRRRSVAKSLAWSSIGALPMVRSRDCNRSHALAVIRQSQGEVGAIPTHSTPNGLVRRANLAAATAQWPSGQDSKSIQGHTSPSFCVRHISAEQKSMLLCSSHESLLCAKHST